MLIYLLVGALLGQRFKVLALVPAMALAFTLTAVVGFGRGGAFWQVLGSALIPIVGLQIGYLAGIWIHYLTASARKTLVRKRSFDPSISSRPTVN